MFQTAIDGSFAFQDQFSKQLAHLALRRLQSLPPKRCGAIHPAQRFAVALFGRAQITLILEAVQERIQTTGADPVSVPRELLDHAETEDGLFDGVVQDVKADESGIQL